MIDWDPLIEPKFVKQAFLQPALLSHHPPVPNRFDGLLQNTSSVSLLSEFFNGILADLLRRGFANVTSDINEHRGFLIVHLCIRSWAIRSGKDLRRETL